MKWRMIAVSTALLALLTMGCQGYRVTTEVTDLTEEEYEPQPAAVDFYFANAEPDYWYSQVAFIEIVGTEYQTTEELLEEMEYEALELGADAVMAVRKTYTVRERYSVWHIINEEPPEEYIAPVLTGVAIVYVTDCYCLYKKAGSTSEVTNEKGGK